jgi:small-conductance mechanosensitive channel
VEELANKYLFDPTIGRLISTAVGILLVLILVRFLKGLLSKYVRDSSTRYRARKFVTFFGYLLGILVVTTVYSDRLGGFTVALGVAGAGIAFALQEVIASVAGWFAITFARFYKTGDRVQLGGIKGDVVDIGILRTTLMEIGDWVQGDLYNGRVARVANSFVFKEPVFNYSGDFPFLWDEIVIPVRYGSDLELARQLISRVAGEVLDGYAKDARTAWGKLVKKYPIEDAQVKPLVTLMADENWASYTLRYVVDFRRRRITKDTLFTRILSEIEASKGRVSVATTAMDVTLIGPDPNYEPNTLGGPKADPA